MVFLMSKIVLPKNGSYMRSGVKLNYDYIFNLIAVCPRSPFAQVSVCPSWANGDLGQTATWANGDLGKRRPLKIVKIKRE